MKTIEIPGKTFLFGEYLATQGGSSLVFTSKPLFALTGQQTPLSVPCPFHPDSPAGKLFKCHQDVLQHHEFSFINPYQHGGLGASTAEFLGLYQYTQAFIDLKPLNAAEFVKLYQSLSSKQGIKPSGSDLIAQKQRGISYFHPNEKKQKSHTWTFDELSLLLFHTNQKLATHEHLQSLNLAVDLSNLQVIANRAYDAFKQANEIVFIHEINTYGGALNALNLVEKHTLAILNTLKREPRVLAAKGCGALGADVFMVLCKPHHKKTLINELTQKGYPLMATEIDLCR